MATALRSAPAPLFLPFDRCTAIAKLTPQQRTDEYNRARMIALLDDSGQRSFFKRATESSLFSAFELLAMVRRFKHVDDWRSGNLWKMLGVTCGEARQLKHQAEEVPQQDDSQADEVRERLKLSGNSCREIARISEMSCATVERFLGGEHVTSRILAKLSKAEIREKVLGNAEVRERLLKSNKKTCKLATDAGVSFKTLYSFLKGKSVTPRTLRKLENSLESVA